MLLFSDMGLAANNSLLIPSFVPLMHLEKHAVLRLKSHKSVNTKIAILIKAHITGYSASLELHISPLESFKTHTHTGSFEPK